MGKGTVMIEGHFTFYFGNKSKTAYETCPKHPTLPGVLLFPGNGPMIFFFVCLFIFRRKFARYKLDVNCCRSYPTDIGRRASEARRGWRGRLERREM